MINPFDLPSLWKAIRTFSLTFAVVFSSALLGVSVTRLLRKALGELSLPWILLWLIPMVLIGLVARHEHRIIRNAVLRRQIAVVLLLGAVSVHLVLTRLQRRIAPPEPDPYARTPAAVAPAKRPPDTDSAEPDMTPASPDEGEDPRPRRRGPRSK